MSHFLQIATTIFDICWLCAALLLLWLIWRSSVSHVQHIERTLIDVSMRNAETAQRAANAALLLAEQYRDQHKTQP